MNDSNDIVVVDHQNDNDNDHSHSPTTSSSSFSQKLHSSICNMSCCFGTNKHHHHRPISPVHVSKTGLLRSSSVWTKSRANDPTSYLPEIKDKCRTLISRIGGRHHRRRHSADFHYDALSYSRNFDQGGDEENDDVDEFPFRSFSSRLPLSPPVDDDDEDEEPRSAPASSSSSNKATTPEIIRAL
ncbi:hypothetical protein TorRG33x02_305310 [Trema orientale]|uniref:Uncharacterized protein n=1 Tax=Trema orientale TaxID=63057 RepID=A0A2P5BXN0_TREOI|nr:hypothetical protein TorRG33x02_305310 [Trema orientale]